MNTSTDFNSKQGSRIGWKAWLLLIPMICLPACSGGSVESVSNREPDRIRSASKVESDPNDWPWWSGPNRNFVADSNSVPIQFSSGRNCLWIYSVEGEGHASPVVVGDQVFLASADQDAQTMSLVSISRKDGSELWQRELHQGRFMHTHSKNSHASSTPASDGEHVFTAFMFDDSIWVSAVNFQGDIVWQQNAGSFTSRHGYGSSPVIYRSLVIVAGDNPGSGFISAFDRQTGELVWRINRKNESSYGTPIVAKVNGQDQLIISGNSRLHGYDPATGEEVWSSSGPAQTTANTVATDGELIFSGGGYPEKRFFCVDPRSSEIRWKVNLKSYVPSPVLWNEYVLIPQDGGILSCLSQKDGKEVWKKRTREDLSGSGVVLGSNLYLGGEKGSLFVFDLDKQGELVAKNRLGSRIMSTPAICGDQLFVRTADKLFCFANPTIEKAN